MPVIDVVNLSKAFGPKVVLSDVNLSVEEGESLVVLGGSGTGKTVLLRNIMGLLTPDSGHVAVEGKIIGQLSRDELFQVRQSIGMCFQMAALFDSMTVFENVAFGLRRHQKMAEGQIQARVGLPASTLSHHLADLTEAGLLKAERQGTTIRYAVRFDELRALTDYLWQDCCGGGCRDPHCL